ncbi:MAG: GTPase domain-containing protein [Myxococcales bacterium]|nr:GTPase domain-containing protein [Myxococcales bacterium]
MESGRRLRQLNDELQRFLASPEPAAVQPLHGPDDLMVWFLLGGKDVGKSSFLNALFGKTINAEPRGSAEGTARFVAYLHEAYRAELQKRLDGLPIDIEFQLHQSEALRQLCVIDSPDFDSRFDRHVNQVRRVIQAGVTDGAVLLASPAKYKDRQFWQAFEKLADAISPQHILFALTKADSLGDYLAEVRADFTATIARRLGRWQDQTATSRRDEPATAVFLIDSLTKNFDFPRLEDRLLSRMTTAEVRRVQDENQQHAAELGLNQIRRHYQLDEFQTALNRAADPERQEEIFDSYFPAPYFLLLGERLRNREEIGLRLRRGLAANAEHTLAGFPTILGVGRWFGSLLPFRQAGGQFADNFDELRLPASFFQWGQENLTDRLLAARRETGAELLRQWPEMTERYLHDEHSIEIELAQCVADQLPAAGRRLFSRPFQILLNLPVYLYALFFLVLVFYPAFILLQAWSIFPAPRLADWLTLDNVRMSFFGFFGYYTIASFYVARRRRMQLGQVMDAFIQDSLGALEDRLKAMVAWPITRISRDFTVLAASLPPPGDGRPETSLNSEEKRVT